MKAEDREELEKTGDYIVDEKHKTVTLTETGMAKAEKMLAHRLQPGGLYDPANMPLLHHIHQALRAHALFRLDVDYMIKDGGVVIVDHGGGWTSTITDLRSLDVTSGASVARGEALVGGDRGEGGVGHRLLPSVVAKVVRRRWSESRRSGPLAPSSPPSTASMIAQSGESGRCVQPRGAPP